MPFVPVSELKEEATRDEARDRRRVPDERRAARGDPRAARARLHAARGVHARIPSDDIDAALGAQRSRLSLAAGLGGLAGAVAAYALQWYLVAYLYPLDVGGRPPHMPLPFLIITFEMGFLSARCTVFVAFLIACAAAQAVGSDRSTSPASSRATRDRFWLAVDGDDPDGRPRGARATLLRDAGRARHDVRRRSPMRRRAPRARSSRAATGRCTACRSSRAAIDRRPRARGEPCMLQPPDGRRRDRRRRSAAAADPRARRARPRPLRAVLRAVPRRRRRRRQLRRARDDAAPAAVAASTRAAACCPTTAS